MSVNKKLSSFKKGYSLPQEYYVDHDIFDMDMEKIFSRHWLYVGPVSRIKNSGDYITFNYGDESVIIVRDDENNIRAMHNVCCHRGARICSEPCGSVAKLTCPYHLWTYDLDGQLIHAGMMGKNFDPGKYKLQPVHVKEIAGLIFVNLSNENLDSIDLVEEKLAPYIEPYEIHRTKVAKEIDIVENGNWKLVLENNRECYHCSDNHPELVVPLHPHGFGAVIPEDEKLQSADDRAFMKLMKSKEAEWEKLGLPYELIEFPDDLWFRTMRLPLANDCMSQTFDGKVASKKLLGKFKKPEGSSLTLWTHPNSWHHFMCDHIVTFTVLPLNEGQTIVKTRWLVHEDAVEGEDYDLEHMTHVWNNTNAQDKELVELGQMGVSSRGYRPGPYSVETEGLVTQFIDWYGRKFNEGANDDDSSYTKTWDGETADLVCTDIKDETHDVKTFTFKAADDTKFDYQPGQNILFTFRINNEEICRNYTLSSCPLDKDRVSITVKRKVDGVVSNWLHDNVKIGDSLNAIGPNGVFTYVDKGIKKLLLLSGGSGVTPVYSMLRHALEIGYDGEIVFIHAARTVDDFIFKDELDKYAEQYSNLKSVYIPADADKSYQGHTGFLTKDILDDVVGDFSDHSVFCCGPEGFMMAVRDILDQRQFSMDHYYEEIFNFDMPSIEENGTDPVQESTMRYSITLKKSDKIFECGNAQNILDAAIENGIRLQHGCQKGMCGACKVHKSYGDVTMTHEGGIRDNDVENGDILICCSKPNSNVVIDL